MTSFPASGTGQIDKIKNRNTLRTQMTQVTGGYSLNSLLFGQY